MREARLKTRILVQAAVRLCTQQAIPIAIARRGDEEAGAILIKLNRRDLLSSWRFRKRLD